MYQEHLRSNNEINRQTKNNQRKQLNEKEKKEEEEKKEKKTGRTGLKILPLGRHVDSEPRREPAMGSERMRVPKQTFEWCTKKYSEEKQTYLRRRTPHGRQHEIDKI
jgi:hypothetical protein